jgi:hypothetical protein
MIFEVKEDRFMGIHGRITLESQSYGLLIWIYQSRRIRSQYAWLWSRSHGWQRHPVIEDEMAMSIWWLTQASQHNLQLPTRLSSMPIRKLQTKSIWCDVCRLAYPKGHIRQQTPAIWQVVSETQKHKGRTRHYCQECANFAQVWHDGSVWTFRQQLDYALGKEQLDGMELGQL